MTHATMPGRFGRSTVRLALAALAGAAIAAPGLAGADPRGGFGTWPEPPAWGWNAGDDAFGHGWPHARGWQRAHARELRRAYEQGWQDALRRHRGAPRPAAWEPDPWATARPLGPRDIVWRGRDGRLYCRRGDGTTGMVIGALAGGTLGTALAGEGQRRLGSVVGGSLGAIIGREIDRGSVRCG